ncbi:MAG: hypothetical protein K0R13_2170 [Propionibacteriaceae bacterium]|nr:hypothetical protein [Propionibacteriaceae bacterium]
MDPLAAYRTADPERPPGQTDAPEPPLPAVLVGPGPRLSVQRLLGAGLLSPDTDELRLGAVGPAASNVVMIPSG